MRYSEPDNITVRPSRDRPGFYVLSFRDSGHAVEPPSWRLRNREERYNPDIAYFDTPDAALTALGDWLTEADETAHIRGPAVSRATKPPKVATYASELAKLRADQRKRDADPMHGWHPCSGAHCRCIPGPTFTRNYWQSIQEREQRRRECAT